jgi:hypothetical protein
MNCLFCNLSQANEMIFIEGYCWNCLTKTQKASGLPTEVFLGFIKEGAVITGAGLTVKGKVK